VTPWFLLCRLLSILAIVGIVIAPLAAPADASMAKAVSMASKAGDMPCCPVKPAKMDCDGKAMCPVMSICMFKCFQAGPLAPHVLAAHPTVIALLDPRDDDQWASHSPLPPSRPPRS
jgi:hypothetical protein